MQHIKLSVIVPYYKEKPAELFPLLSSLNCQMGIDHSEIECILVNDGADNKLPDDFLGLFRTIDIKCIYLPDNKGPGLARQAGVDAANGEYVMFCDADDCLVSMFVFSSIMDVIENNHPDFFLSPWLEERYDPASNTYHYVRHDIDFVWLFGKVFQRSFLNEKKLRFHEALRIHEDSYFMALIALESKEVYKMTTETYVWRDRPTSITRENNHSYFYVTLPEFVKSVRCILEDVQKRHPAKVTAYVTKSIINVYFILQDRAWQTPEREELLQKAELAFGRMIPPWLTYFENAPEEAVAATYNQERAESFKGQIETERLEDWLSRVTELARQEE